MSWQAIVFRPCSLRGRCCCVDRAAARPLHGRRLRRPRRRHRRPATGSSTRSSGSSTASAASTSKREQRWNVYALSLVAFSLVSVLVLYVLQRLQGGLPFNPTDRAAVTPMGSFNVAVSFVTNTNWQWYSGELTMSHLTQMIGLTVQNFVSAAAGMAVVDRPDPRHHPHRHPHPRQLLGRPDPHDRAHPAAAVRWCSPSC